MLLESKLINFRQFVNEYIEFSTNPDKNVTIIFGENGTGKTTFAQAFFWCLYGENTFKDSLLNKNVENDLFINQEAYVKVCINLKHGDNYYEIIRKQAYKKLNSNKLKADNSIVEIIVRNSDGNTNYIKPIKVEDEIKKILPKELSRYFFFDGERIDKVSKEITDGKKSDEFKEAVNGLTGLKAIQESLKYLDPNSASSVIGKLNKSYTNDASGKMKELTTRIDAIREELVYIENRIEEIDNEIEISKQNEKCFSEKIKQFEEGRKLQNLRDKYEKQLKDLKISKDTNMKMFIKEFNCNSMDFFGINMVKRSLLLLSNHDFAEKDIPNMHSKTIEYLLKRGICICGTKLDEGTSSYEKVKELLQYLPPASIGVVVGQFYKDSKNRYKDSIELSNNLKEYVTNISRLNDSISEIEADVTSLNTQLSESNIDEQVKSLNNQINYCKKNIMNLNNEKNKLLMNKGALTEELKIKENKRKELSLLDTNNRFIEICRLYAEKLYNDMNSEFLVKSRNIKRNLEKEINDIFNEIFEGEFVLKIDPNYKVAALSPDVSKIIDGQNKSLSEISDFKIMLSTAQSTSVIFAFICAILKMARESREMDSDSTSEPYPLVMDAPLSSFDKRRIKAICETLPERAEQVIIFIKDIDGELAEKYMGNRIGVSKKFNKINRFQTKLE